MGEPWIVVLEVRPLAGAPEVSADRIQGLVQGLAGSRPVVLYNPDCYAIQTWVDATTPMEALSRSVSQWRESARSAALPDWEVVRADVISRPQFERECLAEAQSMAPAAHAQPLRPLCQALRDLVAAEREEQVSAVLDWFIVQLGGRVVPLREADDWALAVDIVLDEEDRASAQTQRVVVAAPGSSAREELERLLPQLVADARRARARLSRERESNRPPDHDPGPAPSAPS